MIRLDYLKGLFSVWPSVQNVAHNKTWDNSYRRRGSWLGISLILLFLYRNTATSRHRSFIFIRHFGREEKVTLPKKRSRCDNRVAVSREHTASHAGTTCLARPIAARERLTLTPVVVRELGNSQLVCCVFATIILSYLGYCYVAH